jgi:hypothetical protein
MVSKAGTSSVDKGLRSIKALLEIVGITVGILVGLKTLGVIFPSLSIGFIDNSISFSIWLCATFAICYYCLSADNGLRLNFWLIRQIIGILRSIIEVLAVLENVNLEEDGKPHPGPSVQRS